MMVSMGAVTDRTVVVVTCHDSQVLNDLPDHLFGPHDLTADYILTPSQVELLSNCVVGLKLVSIHL